MNEFEIAKLLVDHQAEINFLPGSEDFVPDDRADPKYVHRTLRLKMKIDDKAHALEATIYKKHITYGVTIGMELDRLIGILIQSNKLKATVEKHLEHRSRQNRKGQKRRKRPFNPLVDGNQVDCDGVDGL